MAQASLQHTFNGGFGSSHSDWAQHEAAVLPGQAGRILAGRLLGGFGAMGLQLYPSHPARLIPLPRVPTALTFF